MQPDIQQPKPTQQAQPEPATVTPPSQPSGGKKFSFGGKKAKIAGLIVAGVILLGAVGAGAYYGIYLPNTPENILKKSVINTLEQDQLSGKGSASFTGKDAPGVTANYSLQTDSTKNAASATVEISISGVKFPLEVRSVDKAVYVKVGDLRTVQALATATLGAESAPFVDSVVKQVSNKWIEFDESLLKSYGGDKCSVLSQNNKMSEEDIKKLTSIYDNNEFVEIKKTSNDTVDGRKVIKAELGINKEKAKSFGKDIEDLAIIKKLNECSGDKKAEDKATKEAEDFKGSYELTVWVDKSKKELVKVSAKTTEDGETMSADFTFNKDQVNITKPEGAVPAMEVLSQFLPLFSGGATTPLGQ